MKIQYKASALMTLLGVVIVILISVFYRLNNQKIAINTELNKLKIISKEVAFHMESHLQEKANIAVTISSAPHIRDALLKSNSKLEPLTDKIRKDEIERQNRQWMETTDINDPFIQKYMKNAVGEFFKHQQTLLPGEYGEIFLTNRFGAMIATTGKLTTLSHAHKYWWLECYNDGQGRIFFDDRGFDTSVEGYVLGMVVPIKYKNRIIGILKCNFNIIGPLTEVVKKSSLSVLAMLKIVRTGGLIVYENDRTPLSTQVDKSLIELLWQKKDSVAILPGTNGNQLVAYSSIPITIGSDRYGFGGKKGSIDHIKGNEGEAWHIVVSLDEEKVIESTHKTTRLIIFIGIIFTFFTTVASLLFGKWIATPIVRLSTKAWMIGEGNLDTQVPIGLNDEIGSLSKSLNKMVRNLKNTMASKDELLHEIELREKTEVERDRILSFSNDLICIAGMDGYFKYVNPAWEKLLGYPTKELLSRPFLSFIHPNDHKKNGDEVTSLAEGKETVNFENRYICKDGSVLHVEWRATPLIEENHMYCFGRNITERKQSQKKLIFLEKRNRALLDHSPVCHKIADLDFNLQYMSTNGFKMLQLDQNAEVYGKPYPFEFFPESFRNEMTETMKRVKETGDTLTIEGLTNDVEGNEVWLDSTLVPVLDDDGKIDYITVVSSDITQRMRDEKDRKRLEENLIQAQKAEAIGTLAGGIAHDFNNILFPITGMSELLLEDLAEDSLEYENALEILTAGKRGAELVKQILSFSRQSKHEMVPTRIQKILREVLKLSRSTIPSYIEIIENIQPDCGLIMADPTQIHQVAMNIITNAYHAVEADDGKITVRLRETQLEEADLPVINLEPGEYAILSVSDTGSGISAELMDKIFDPYFTTKERGKGTGLGLAVVYGIVQKHKGDIKVYSEIGKGTTFNVYLPLMDKTAKSDTKEVTENLQTGDERILLVDDEPSIAKLEKQMLERLGYSITMRINSMEALEAFRERPDSFDMVISDMNMPNMAGDQLASEIKSIRSEIPFILCTGFSHRMNKEKADILGIAGILMKPVIKSEMAKTVRKLLDEAKRASRVR
ncbi:PAS domain-containing protein [Desulfococcaceae bacterium HSG7]|nr:PAS domain-containing protein [Desulfococcaceae bacterium HSG7]